VRSPVVRNCWRSVREVLIRGRGFRSADPPRGIVRIDDDDEDDGLVNVVRAVFSFHF